MGQRDQDWEVGRYQGLWKLICSQLTHFMDDSTETQQKLSDMLRLPRLLDDVGQLEHRGLVLNVERAPSGE